MYEYRITTHYGTMAPASFTAPTGFRLHDMKYVETGRILSWSSEAVGVHPSSGGESSNGNWVVIWERYVPEQGEI